MQPTDINIIIVIPVFRPTLSSDEKASLRQCLKVLGPHHDVALVCPDSLDTAAYDGAAAEKLRAERFKDSFFEGIEGYNSLMMSHTFYNRFSNYDWMLVYQLDAWIFEDRLEEWCRKGYDYVGAPWFENNESHETGWHLWRTGNGGLSLRRLEKFLRITQSGCPIRVPRVIWSHRFRRKDGPRRRVSLVLGKRDMTVGQYMQQLSATWEDYFFCISLEGTSEALQLPSPEEAARFSVERSPRWLVETVLRGHRPMGCHAWRKYQYEEFWKQYIKPEA